MKKELNVGVVGFSGQKFDEKMARAFIDKAFDLLDNEDKDICVISGLTYVGIPAIAYDVAKERGYKTIGVACSKAKEYECFDVDEKYIEGEEWGDESEKFLSMLDVMIKVGGGKQSEEEVKKFKESGKPVIEFDLKAKKS